MLRRASQWLFVVALSTLALATSARAATFDLIWADQINVTTYPSNSGFTLAGTDICLLVNKGSTDINGPEFFGATFTSTSSNPLVSASPFINDGGPPIMPVLPNQAIGSVGSNSLLPTKLLPGETLHDTSGFQLLALQCDYPPGFSGTVVFNLTMTMGGNRASYSILANFTPGTNFAISFPHVSRVSSVPLATAAKPTTWGAIKKLYR